MTSSSTDRNSPCPCGSGWKFKKCCWELLRFTGVQPPRVFSAEGKIPAIRTFDDLQPFWDAVVAKLLLFKRHGWSGLGPLLGIIAATDLSHYLQRTWNLTWDWNADESLRYMARHVFRSPGPLGTLETVSTVDAARARRTIDWFEPLSHVRDQIETVRLGLGSVQIAGDQRLVQFFDCPDTGIDVARREYFRFAEQNKARDDDSVSQAFRENCGRIAEQLTNPRAFMHEDLAAWRAVELLLDTKDVETWPTQQSAWLPDDLDLECFSVGEYRRSWAVLKIASLIHRTLCARLIQTGTLPSYNLPILYLDKLKLVEQLARLIGITAEKASNIIQDLTYPVGVKNVDPYDHPLLPTEDGFMATVDRLIRGAEWEGALVRSLERLPWRQRARMLLGRFRERSMQEWVESKVAHLGADVRHNIAVGPKAARIGDVDILLFRQAEEVALALSLKWLYEPRLVQEVASQSARLQEAVNQHDRLLAAMRQDIERLARLHSFPATLELLPAVVVHPGPVLQRVKNPRVPAMTSSDFDALATTASSLAALGKAIQEKQRELPPLDISPREFRWWISGYWFITPGYDLRRNRERAPRG